MHFRRRAKVRLSLDHRAARADDGQFAVETIGVVGTARIVGATVDAHGIEHRGGLGVLPTGVLHGIGRHQRQFEPVDRHERAIDHLLAGMPVIGEFEMEAIGEDLAQAPRERQRLGRVARVRVMPTYG